MSVEAQIAALKSRLRTRMGCREEDIRVVYAPLRICPLGAHVDHQDGLVTGMTLNRAIILAFVPRRDGRVHIDSMNFPGCADFPLDGIPPRVQGDWGNHGGLNGCRGGSDGPFLFI